MLKLDLNVNERKNMFIRLITSFLAFVIFPEEKYLEDKFGDVYIRYKKSVNRWI